MVLVTASTVSVVAGVAIGRYAIPDKGASTDTATVPPTPGLATPTPTAFPSALVPAPNASGGADAGASGAEASQVPGVPTRVNEFGIPVGYPRTQAGAVSACANYDAINGKPQNREPTTIRKLYGSVASPEVAKKLSDIIIENDKKSAKNYGVSSMQAPNFAFLGRALGYTLDRYNQNEANVTIWGVLGFGIYGSSDTNLAPREGWGTVTCRVAWTDGDWKLADAGDGPASPAITDRAAEAFKEFILVGAGS